MSPAPSAARKTPIVAGMLLAMSMMACNYARSDALVVAFMSLAFVGVSAAVALPSMLLLVGDIRRVEPKTSLLPGTAA